MTAMRCPHIVTRECVILRIFQIAKFTNEAEVGRNGGDLWRDVGACGAVSDAKLHVLKGRSSEVACKRTGVMEKWKGR